MTVSKLYVHPNGARLFDGCVCRHLVYVNGGYVHMQPARFTGFPVLTPVGQWLQRTIARAVVESLFLIERLKAERRSAVGGRQSAVGKRVA
jgi:hypothetical protein